MRLGHPSLITVALTACFTLTVVIGSEPSALVLSTELTWGGSDRPQSPAGIYVARESRVNGFPYYKREAQPPMFLYRTSKGTWKLAKNPSDFDTESGDFMSAQVSESPEGLPWRSSFRTATRSQDDNLKMLTPAGTVSHRGSGSRM